MGLAPTPHAREGNLPARFCLVQRGFCFAQRGEEASWPARARYRHHGVDDVAGPVESRRVHAAANPRVRAAAMPSGRAGIPVMRGQGDARATAPVNLGDAEGFIADGRRPGSTSSVALDEAAGRGGPGGTADAVFGPLLTGRPGQRRLARVATEGVRGHVTSSVRGRKRRDREVSRGGAFDRSSARIARCPLRRERSGLRLRTLTGNGSCAMAEAGGSPSSDAPPVDRPEVQRLKADRCSALVPREGWEKAARTGIGGSVLGARDRKSVAEVGERHLSPCTLGAPTTRRASAGIA